MKFYNCQVRLGGSVLASVPKYNISDKEIHVLRNVHGDDAVVNIVEVKPENRNEKTEIEMLTTVYGAKAVEATFGRAMMKDDIVASEETPSAKVPDKKAKE